MGDNGSDRLDGELALKVLDQLPTPVLAVDNDMRLIYMNETSLQFIGKTWEGLAGKKCYEVFETAHCQTEACRMRQVIAGEPSRTVRNEVRINGQLIPVEYTTAALRNREGTIVGGLEYVIDISERVQQERKLREQSRTIMEISTPAIKLWDRVVILPVVGVVDSLRAQQMMNTMLVKIMDTSAKVIILDIQGVAAVDTAVANHLIKIAKATKLMGCRCIISGISPAVAETIVQLGIDLGDIATNSTLQDALSEAFSLMGLEVIARK